MALDTGSSNDLHDPCENVLQTSLYLAEPAKVVMAFRELYHLDLEYKAKEGYRSDIERSIEPTATNIGHSISLSWPDDNTHMMLGYTQSFKKGADVMRTGRSFLNPLETQPIMKNMAFTIEARF